MENITDTAKMMNELAQAASNLFVDLVAAKNLVEEGKEVLCARKLQGALVRYAALEQIMLDYFSKDDIKTDEVAEEGN